MFNLKTAKRTAKSMKSGWLNSAVKRYKSCHEGVAAIEFAFVAPIMILMYIGLAEISMAISVDRKISHAANVAGDLATQSATVNAAEMTEIMNATLMVMGIRANKHSNLKMQVTSYSRDGDGNVQNEGSATLNGPYPTVFNASALDTRILSDTSGIVVARVTYNYEPMKSTFLNSEGETDKIFDGNFDLTETFMLKPRKSAIVEIKEPDGSNVYTCNFVNNKPNCTAS